MKSKILAYILITTFLSPSITVFAENKDLDEQPAIVSEDIQEAVKDAKRKKIIKENKHKKIDKIFIDAETSQVVDESEKDTDAIKSKVTEEIEQEPAIEAFGVPETDGKVLQASVEKIPVLSIDDCIKMALENNPSIMSSIANTKIYKTKIGQAWANYFPKVGVGIGYTRNKYLPMFFTPSVSKYNSYTMPSIDAEWISGKQKHKLMLHQKHIRQRKKICKKP